LSSGADHACSLQSLTCLLAANMPWRRANCRVTRTLSAFLDRDTLLAFETALSQAGELDTAFEVQHLCNWDFYVAWVHSVWKERISVPNCAVVYRDVINDVEHSYHKSLCPGWRHGSMPSGA